MNRLPENVRSLISASNQLNNHTKAVEELVYNSIDAGATSVAIRVNIEENIIQVIDNGCGVSKTDLKCIGQSYMTSKFVDLTTLNSAPNKYGFRGQSLANLINISESVTIISRHENFEETWKKIFENSREKKIDRCSSRPSKGTTVEIKGFLYNLNIKKKNIWNDLQSIKTLLERLSLVHSNVSLSLRDDMKNEIIFKIHKSRDLYQTLLTLYNIAKEDIQEFIVEKNEYKVRGILGKSEKECGRNNIFLNGKYISDSSKLHKTVNNYIKTHLHKKDRKIRKIKNRDDEENCLSQNKRKFYLIFITCPYLDYNLSCGEQLVLEFKDWNQVNKLLEKLTKFAAGDVNLKEVIKNVRDKPNTKKIDSRQEVKKIMEKILGSQSKKPGISHTYKGIKGKKIKRKKRQPSVNKLISKVIQDNTKNKNFTVHSIDGDGSKLNIHDNNFVPKKSCHTNMNKKEINERKFQTDNHSKSNNSKRRTETNVGKIYNSKLKILSKHNANIVGETEIEKRSANKFHKSKKPRINNLLRKFQLNNYSVQKRCNELEQRVKNALNEKNKRKEEVYAGNTVDLFRNITENNRNVSVRKEINEIVIHRYIPKSKVCELKDDHNNIKDNKEKRFHSNYDLLETILKSQKIYNTQKTITHEPLPILIDSQTQQNTNNIVNRPIDLEINTNSLEPLVTFESHNYFAHKKYSTSDPTHRPQMEVPDYDSLEMEVTVNDDCNLNRKPRFFLTKQSKDNFNSVYERDKISKRNSKSGYSKRFRQNTKKLFKLTPKPFRLNHLIGTTTEKSYTIDFTDSNSNKLMNNTDSFGNLRESNWMRNTFSVNIEETWTQSAKYRDHEEQSNKHVSVINATYTLSNTCNKSKKNYSKLYENGTYTIENTNASPSKCNALNESVGINNDINNQDYIFISKSQDHDDIEKMLDPRDLCETILGNQNLMNNESDKSNNQSNLDIYATSNQEVIEFTETSLQCGQKKASEDTLEKLSQHFSFPDTEFNTSDIAEMLRMEDYVQNKMHLEIQDNFVQELENNINVTEKDNNDDGFNLKNRPCFLPKGMSPIFENCRTKQNIMCQYELSREYYEDDMYNNFMDNVRNNAEVFEPNIQDVEDVTTKAIVKVNAKLNKDNSSLKFNAKDLRNAKILGQVDDKFIAAIIKGGSSNDVSDFLVLFDQHAVHERIRLEKNLSEYLVDNQWVSINIEEVTLNISKDEALFLHNYREKFMQLGVQWTVLNYDEVSIGAVPAAILGKNIREGSAFLHESMKDNKEVAVEFISVVDKVMKAVKNLITEERNIIRMQSGCVSLYPKSIMDLVFSEACRYAIKFGEKLTESRCVELLKALSECKTPFQCAHGRPAMAVIMEITNIKPDYKTNKQKILEWKAKYNFK